jgi:succinate-acetate transporter protein
MSEEIPYYIGILRDTNTKCYREMALGNTFSATSFCSYGAYWITFGVISDLEGTKIIAASETVCQKEILMGLFLLVSPSTHRNVYHIVVFKLTRSLPIHRHGSSSLQ